MLSPQQGGPPCDKQVVLGWILLRKGKRRSQEGAHECFIEFLESRAGTAVREESGQWCPLQGKAMLE